MTILGTKEVRAIETRYLIDRTKEELPPGPPGYLRRKISISGSDEQMVVTVLDVETSFSVD